MAYLGAVVLAGVFVVAAGTKLARRQSATAGFRALALPAPQVLGRVVPVVELAVATALVAVPRVGGALALVALVIFSSMLAARIRAGTVASCACFGSVNQDAVSFVELVRNGLLGVLAVVALFAMRPAVPTLEATITVSVAVVTGVLVVGLARLRQRVGAVWSNSDAREGARA